MVARNTRYTDTRGSTEQTGEEVASKSFFYEEAGDPGMPGLVKPFLVMKSLLPPWTQLQSPTPLESAPEPQRSAAS